MLSERKKVIADADSTPNAKRRRTGKFPKLDHAMDTWIMNARAKGAPINGDCVKEKAKDFANLLGVPEGSFKASDGYHSYQPLNACRPI